MNELLKLLLAAAAITAIAVIILNWDSITNWFYVNKTNDAKLGKLIREGLSNGNYNLVGGIFNQQEALTHKNSWENVKLSDDVLSKFGDSNVIEINLSN